MNDVWGTSPVNSIMITCHYPDVSSVFNWSCHVGNLLQPIRSTTQIWEVTSHQYGVFALVSQTSFRGKTNSGVAECRLFSWAAFKSNHHHSELTNRNVALRDAHCNSRIWICRRKRYQRKEWEQRKKKGLYFWWYSVDCCAHVIGSRCARGKTYCTFNTRDISWDGGVFSAPSMSVLAVWHHRSKKINTGREGAQLFVGIMCTARGVPAYCDENWCWKI